MLTLRFLDSGDSESPSVDIKEAAAVNRSGWVDGNCYLYTRRTVFQYFNALLYQCALVELQFSFYHRLFSLHRFLGLRGDGGARILPLCFAISL